MLLMFASSVNLVAVVPAHILETISVSLSVGASLRLVK